MSGNDILAQRQLSLRDFCGIEADGKKRDPIDPPELRRYCLTLRDLIARRREFLLSRTLLGQRALPSDRDFTPEIAVVWHLLVGIAGAASYPPFEPGPYPRDRAVAALDRVVNWCDDATKRQRAAGTTQLPEALPPSPPAGPAGPSVDDEDVSILRALAEARPRRVSQDHIASRTKPRVSRRTVSERMPRLLADGLAALPRGKKMGYTITQPGLDLLKVASQPAP
jgi:hypothetical protein